MKRGDFVMVAASGDYGKPRPALVVQSDALSGTDSVLVCQMTTTLRDAAEFRLRLEPEPATGLRRTSDIMLDKMIALRRERIGAVIGSLPAGLVPELDRRLAFVIGVGT